MTLPRQLRYQTTLTAETMNKINRRPFLIVVAAAALAALGFSLPCALAAADTGQPTVSPDAAETSSAYPRIGMLWSPVRDDWSMRSFARHNLIMMGQGALGLKPDAEPEGLASHAIWSVPAGALLT